MESAIAVKLLINLKILLFSKIITKTFGAYDFLLYLCKRFRNKKAMASKIVL